MTGWGLATCLGLAAAVVAWPAPRGTRSRLRRMRVPAATAAPGPGRPWWSRRPHVRVPRWRPLLALLPAAGVTALAAILGGPVAGLAAAAYSLAAVRAAARRAIRLARTARRREILDHLSSAAADLRAGLPVADALAAAGHPVGASTGPFPRPDGGGTRRPPVDDGTGPLRARIAAAVTLADRTGAPLADLLERVDGDARAADRAGAAVAAQAAGFQATSWLLAGLPAAGIALGYAIGADPLRVLLHTPVGAACTAAAVGLQLAGVSWTGRIMRAAGGTS